MAAVLGTAAANATPTRHVSTVGTKHVDSQVDIDARHDVALAPEQIPAGSRYQPLSRLEGAEIALLRVHSDFSPLLGTGLLARRTSPVSELDQARIDVLRRDAEEVRSAAGSSDPITRAPWRHHIAGHRAARKNRKENLP